MKISCSHVSFQGFSLLFHDSDLLSHIHFEAFNALAEISFSALDLAAPNIPIFASALHNDWPANPLQPTSIGSQFILQALYWHCSTNSWYLDLFLSFAIIMCSSHDTVNSQIIHCFVLSEYNTRSGRSDVSTVCLRNLSCVSRSTTNCQSSADDLTLFCFSARAPSLKKIIRSIFLRGWYLLSLIASVTSLRTRSCCQR